MTPLPLQIARILLLKGRPYLGSAAWALAPVERPGIGTLGVDAHWRLYYDPAVFGKWPPDQLAGVLYHEINHLLRVHMRRAEAIGAVDTEALAGVAAVWNTAADAEINDDLEAEKVALPGGYVTPAAIGMPERLLAEEYYIDLMKRAQRVPMVALCGPDGCGSCADGRPRAYELPVGSKEAHGLTQAQAALVVRKVAADVLEHAKTRGTVPDGMRRWAEGLLTPKVPWRRVLAGEIRRSLAVASGMVDYSFRRQQRRNEGPFILPGMVAPIPRVAAVVDTSGSMGAAELRMALAEVKGIIAATGARGALTVLDVDAEVHGVQRVTGAKQVQLRGGGGTDMRLGIARACALKPRPSVVVVLTDGETPWPKEPAIVRCIVVTPEGAPKPPEWMKHVEVTT